MTVFQGTDGRRRIIQSLLSQGIVGHSEEIAQKLTSVAALEQYPLDAKLITQGDSTTDIFFILIGSVSVQINGREVAIRKAGQHVGEMAAIDVRALRSATVITTSETVTAKISEPEFAKIANEHPSIWRELARASLVRGSVSAAAWSWSVTRSQKPSSAPR